MPRESEAYGRARACTNLVRDDHRGAGGVTTTGATSDEDDGKEEEYGNTEEEGEEDNAEDEEVDGGDDDDDDDVRNKEEDARLAEKLRSDLEALRFKTRTALESTWAEVERLQREGSDSYDRVEALERELERLQMTRQAEKEVMLGVEAQRRRDGAGRPAARMGTGGMTAGGKGTQGMVTAEANVFGSEGCYDDDVDGHGSAGRGEGRAKSNVSRHSTGTEPELSPASVTGSAGSGDGGGAGRTMDFVFEDSSGAIEADVPSYHSGINEGGSRRQGAAPGDTLTGSMTGEIGSALAIEQKIGQPNHHLYRQDVGGGSGDNGVQLQAFSATQSKKEDGGRMKRRHSIGLFGMGGLVLPEDLSGDPRQQQPQQDQDPLPQPEFPEGRGGIGGRPKRRPSMGLFGIGGSGHSSFDQVLPSDDRGDALGFSGPQKQRNSCDGRMEEALNQYRHEFEPTRDMPGGQPTVEGIAGGPFVNGGGVLKGVSVGGGPVELGGGGGSGPALGVVPVVGVGGGGGATGMGGALTADGTVRADVLDQLVSLERDKRRMVEELETKLRGKEAAIEALERTTAGQAETIAALQSELDDLRRQSEEEDRAARADAAEIEAEIELNEARATELEALVSEAERALLERREKEDGLKAELEDVEGRIRLAEERAAAHMSELESRLRKAEASRAKYEEENRAMSRRTDEALESLRRDLADYLPPDRSERLISDLMAQFAILKEKEEQLGDALVARMQERQEVVAAAQKMEEVRIRADAGSKAIADMLEQFRASMASLEGEGGKAERGGEGGALESGGREMERMRKKHVAAIAGLERAARAQDRVRLSLRQVEDELLDRLALLDWNKGRAASRGKGRNDGASKKERAVGDVTSGSEMASASAAADAGKYSSGNSDGEDVMEKAERVQLEAKEELLKIREELDAALDEINGKDPSRKKKRKNETFGLRKTLPRPMGGFYNDYNIDSDFDYDDDDDDIDSDEEELDKLEAELEQKDVLIASLQTATAEHERSVESLRLELDRLQASTREESTASLEIMNKLQREVRDIVERVTEKDRMIATLTAILERGKVEEDGLREELDEARMEAESAPHASVCDLDGLDDGMPPDMPDFPQDLEHVGL